MICATNLAPYKGIIHTILAEIYTNMIEHGLLNLDSTQKNNDTGFTHYYEHKDQSLLRASNLELDISVSYEPGPLQNTLTIIVTHNGKGNNEFTATYKEDVHGNPGGRGILLLNSLCEDVEISDDGRRIKVIFQA